MTPPSEEPTSGGADEPRHFGSEDDVDPPLRGWIDPDDRLWRHPSEFAAAPSPRPAIRPGHRVRSRVMVLVGAAAALAAVAWGAILLSPASDHPFSAVGSDASSDSPLTTLAASTGAIPGAADAASHAMVQLRAETSHGITDMVGIAVAEGGLVATTASGLTDLRSLDLVSPDGRLSRASVIAIDPASDLALVNVPDDVPVAPFADDGGLSDGSADMTLSMANTHNNELSLACTPGTVTAVGTAIAAGPALGMPGITTTAWTTSEETGDPLLNQAGAVIGLMYGDATPSATNPPTFLPTQLVLGVADDLRSSGKVAHGWLGVNGPDTSDVVGAAVASVVTGSPAAGRIHPGDVIVDMGSVPIRTMAELRARLYVLAPSTTVALSVVDGAVTNVVDITLSTSP